MSLPINASRPFDSPFSPGINEDNGQKFVPFTVFIETDITTTATKRWEIIRFIQRRALMIEQDLRAVAAIKLTGPVLFKPNFAQKVITFTVNGHYTRSINNIQPMSTTYVIHSGTDIGSKTSYMSGAGNYNLAISTIDSSILSEISAFRTALDAASTEFTKANIYMLHWNGIKLGRGHHSFPT
jgi:hypothetical protein